MGICLENRVLGVGNFELGTWRMVHGQYSIRNDIHLQSVLPAGWTRVPVSLFFAQIFVLLCRFSFPSSLSLGMYLWGEEQKRWIPVFLPVRGLPFCSIEVTLPTDSSVYAGLAWPLLPRQQLSRNTCFPGMAHCRHFTFLFSRPLSLPWRQVWKPQGVWG